MPRYLKNGICYPKLGKRNVFNLERVKVQLKSLCEKLKLDKDMSNEEVNCTFQKIMIGSPSKRKQDNSRGANKNKGKIRNKKTMSHKKWFNEYLRGLKKECLEAWHHLNNNTYISGYWLDKYNWQRKRHKAAIKYAKERFHDQEMEAFFNNNKNLRYLSKCFKKDSDLSASINDGFNEYYKRAFREGDQETVIDEEEDGEGLYG